MGLGPLLESVKRSNYLDSKLTIDAVPKISVATISENVYMVSLVVRAVVLTV
jgi:hypothetical protein